MNIEKIFELVRQEKIVLWAGSGLSKYAGYPLGKELSEILYNSLTIAERGEIEDKMALPDLSEQLIRLKGGKRDHLITLLKTIFLKKPTSIKYHEIISKIPHFKTIITTNYDNLFELAYGKNAIKIVEQSDTGKIDGQKEIFKVHGDLEIPNSIIISKTDYAQFFSNNESTSLFWSVIAERISNKSILFIGYDLEDDNVNNLLEKTWSFLRENRKDAFVVAPGLKKHKIDHLAKKGIGYIDFKGEPFIEKLYQNIKDNIFSDYHNGHVKIETVNAFFLDNNLSFDLKSFNKQFHIDNIRSTNGPLNANIKLAFKNDEVFLQKFSKFANGEEFGTIEIDDKVLNDFKFTASSINLLNNDLSKYKVVLMSKPSQEGLTDISFEDGFELMNVEYKIFTSKKKIKIIAVYNKSTIEISVSSNELIDLEGNVDLRFNPRVNYEHTLDAINTCKFLERCTNGSRLTLYPKESKDIHEFSTPCNPDYNMVIKDHLDFYETLRKVENAYKIKFRDIKQPTMEIYNHCMLALNTLNQNENITPWDDELSFDLNKEGTPLELVLKLNEPGITFKAVSTVQEIIEIYEHKLNLGFKNLIYDDLYIVNLDSILGKKENFAKVRSKSKTVKIIYEPKNIQEIFE